MTSLKPESAAATTDSIPNSLDELICPLSSQAFFSQHWDKSFVHVPGHAGKFGSLFPWSQLNHILEYHRLSPVRLRLFKNGDAIKPRNYLRADGTGGARIGVVEVTRYLAEGATLILDEAEELYQPLRSLASALERIFHVRVRVNLYAGWGTNRGFDLHWDDHDVFILQVAGNKRWTIYNATRTYPVKPDVEESPAPSEPPIWESTLRDGDLLYLPRGFWHVAYPLDEPCLHLTIGIDTPNGISLLHWFVDTLKSSAEARQTLPYIASVQDQAAYIERLKKVFIESWSQNVLENFLEDADAQAIPRPHGQLPFAATIGGAPLEKNTRIRLVAPRRLRFSDNNAEEVVRFRSCGRDWQCERNMLPILKLLDKDGKSHALDELIAVTSSDIDEARIKNFVREMIRSGLFAIEPDV